MTGLEQLARQAGIQEAVPNIEGDNQPVSDETNRRLLKAMDIDAVDEAAAASSLSHLEDAMWSKELPPVLVFYDEKGPFAVPIVLPEGTKEFQWTLALEGKNKIIQQADFNKLELLGTHRLQSSTLERRRLILPEGLPTGYHRLRIHLSQNEMSLIITPGRCWLPKEPTDHHRLWGVATQVYLLRSESNWGIGDYSDLKHLVQLAKKYGADIVGVNPLHALFLDKPEDASPYSPSDRLLLNVLNIDVERVPGFQHSAQAQRLFTSERFNRQLKQCRDADLVQYKTVADLKLEMLKLLYETYKAGEEHLAENDFVSFHQERGELLERACTFQALRLYFTTKDPALKHWSDWPEGYRNSQAPEITRFAQDQPDLIRFQLWLQWLADRQLKDVQVAAGDMAIGLYRDLAVGSHFSGAEAWTNPELFPTGVQVGAPPDPGNPTGQNWGLPAIDPHAFAGDGYRSFINLLRTNMRYAGALRIDHVMALRRLYWIPDGGATSDGAYVEYPMEDLLGIVALESQRNKCVVIGEDLGTVPDGFSERMAEANILSYRVLPFEHGEKNFVAPHEYPYLALSVAGNHDLPPLPGWWAGRDIDLREKLNLFPNEGDAEKARSSRQQDRELLLKSFRQEELISGEEIDAAQFGDAAHRFLGRTKCLLTLVQLDDLMHEDVQINVPGTSDENANWRRRLSLSLDQLASSNLLANLSDAMNEQIKG
jgi:4-alpha-glucanotransferase